MSITVGVVHILEVSEQIIVEFVLSLMEKNQFSHFYKIAAFTL